MALQCGSCRLDQVRSALSNSAIGMMSPSFGKRPRLLGRKQNTGAVALPSAFQSRFQKVGQGKIKAWRHDLECVELPEGLAAGFISFCLATAGSAASACETYPLGRNALRFPKLGGKGEDGRDVDIGIES